MTCPALLAGIGPLVCDNDDPLPHTHTFTASDAPDRHEETEATDD